MTKPGDQRSQTPPSDDVAPVTVVLERRGRVLDSAALFDRETEVGIAHAGVIYRLRITRQGKLILNK